MAPAFPNARIGATRRQALRLGAGAALGLIGAGTAAPALAQSRARVVVVGGGIGGAALASRLARDPALEVVLVSASDIYVTGSFSNLYLAGFRSLSSLSFRHEAAAERGGYRFLLDRAVAVEREAKTVRLASGAQLGYERLALAPGVAFRDSEIVGYDVFARELMPHAYVGGYQTYLLKQRLAQLPEGGLFAVTVPKPPFRGALAPYERASMIALALGRTNPRAKVLILDASDDFPMRAAFEEAWAARYAGRVEWRGAAETGGGLARVDAPNSALVMGDGSTLKVDGASVIPGQRAGSIALLAGIADDDGWAPAEAASLRSRADPSIFVIGDAAQTGPARKSADMALRHAQAAAEAIQADLIDAPAAASAASDMAERQWAFVGHQAALKTVSRYELDQGALRASAETRTVVGAAAPELRDNALEANAWYAATTGAAFGG